MFLLTENTIWRACLKGDKKAFEKLYRLYYPLLYNYGHKFSSDSELIRDCIQNLFAKFILNYQGLSATPSVKGYILKAFRNHLYDSLRAKRAHEAMFLPCIDELLSFEREGTAFIETDDQPAYRRMIVRAFKTLSLRQQEILYLYYVSEANHADIAVTLDINYQSSKNLLSRSLAKLKEAFEQELRIEEESAKVKRG